jgi:hypothetical protein
MLGKKVNSEPQKKLNDMNSEKSFVSHQEMKDYKKLKDHIKTKETVEKQHLNSIISHFLIHRSHFGDMFSLRDYFMLSFLKYCPFCMN